MAATTTTRTTATLHLGCPARLQRPDPLDRRTARPRPIWTNSSASRSADRAEVRALRTGGNRAAGGSWQPAWGRLAHRRLHLLLDSPAGQTGFAPRVSVDLTRNNLWGVAHRVSLRTLLSTLEKEALLTYTWPRFGGNDNLTFDITGLYLDSKDVRTFSSHAATATGLPSQLKEISRSVPRLNLSAFSGKFTIANTAQWKEICRECIKMLLSLKTGPVLLVPHVFKETNDDYLFLVNIGQGIARMGEAAFYYSPFTLCMLGIGIPDGTRCASPRHLAIKACHPEGEGRTHPGRSPQGTAVLDAPDQSRELNS